MTSYLDNLKWIMSGQTGYNQNQNLNPIQINQINKINKINEINEINLNNINNIKTENCDEMYSINGSESESEYHKIVSKDVSTNHEIKNIYNQTFNDIKQDYDKIHIELVKKEQLVRNRVNSDTVERIKENYTDYINDDVQIIKDFAIIMETFEHITEKIKKFEFGIKDFEQDIKKNISSQDENKLELDNKINQIDSRLENTIELMKQIKSNGDEFIKKIIHLENLIKSHDDHREIILSRLEKFDKEHNEIKNHNLKILNFFSNCNQFWLFSRSHSNLYYNNYFKFIGFGIGICSVVLFGYKYLKK